MKTKATKQREAVERLERYAERKKAGESPEWYGIRLAEIARLRQKFGIEGSR